MDESDIREIICKAPNPSCILDPLPSWLVKSLLDSPLPAITTVVNNSLRSGVVPNILKRAIIIPSLKKASLDHNILKNYRPVSNLSFKILERVVSKQLTDYMNVHNLHESLQSAYKQFHSTETALLKVHNDILWAMEKQGVTILVLLDLSSAFDTIDHDILLKRLHDVIGIQDTLLNWFKSYLSDRSQSVLINGKFSSEQYLHFGVPQGSVLGPLLFVIYVLPLGKIVRQFDMNLHIYADDTQIYVSVCPTSSKGVAQAKLKLEDCVHHVQLWMSHNFLKLNADKTEVMVLGYRSQLSKLNLPTHDHC